MIDVLKLTVEELLAIRERFKELGLSVRKPGSGRPATYYPACLAWDWSKSNTEIARENRIAVMTVANYRIRLGKGAPAPKPVHAPVEVATIQAKRDWSKADWNKTDKTISVDVGVSREMVRQRRAQLGLPKAIWSELLYQKFVKAANGATQLSMADAKKLMSISQATFAKYCARAGIKRVASHSPTRIPWHLMNQQLPNILLTEIWRLKTNACASRRFNHNWPKSAFFCAEGSIPEKWWGVVGEERTKAETYFQRPGAGNGGWC